MTKPTTLLRTFILLIALFIGNYTYAQWFPIPQFPGGAVDGAGSFTINSKLYIAGGIGSQKMYMYDPASNMWTPKADIGGGLNRAWPATFVVNGKAYIMGGSYNTASDLTDDMQEYDPVNDKWTTKTKFPGGKRDGMYAFAIGNIGYVGAGFNGSTVDGDFWKYEPSSDTWTQLANSPVGSVIFASTFVVNGKAYVTSGAAAGSNEVKTVYEYDPYTDTWTKKGDFPGAARQAGFAFASSGEGFFGGGMSNYTTIYQDVWKYNPVDDSWNKVQDIPLNSAAWSTAASDGITAYVGTGADFAPGLVFTDSMYKYNIPVSVSNTSNSNIKLGVYPNPVSDILYIKTKEDIKGVTIMDITGKEVLDIQSPNNSINVDVFNSGIYLITVQIESSSKTLRFTKE